MSTDHACMYCNNPHAKGHEHKSLSPHHKFSSEDRFFFIEENKRIKQTISPSSCDVSDATEPRVSHVGEFDEMEVEGDDDDDDDGSESGGSNASQGEILDQDDEMNEQVR